MFRSLVLILAILVGTCAGSNAQNNSSENQLINSKSPPRHLFGLSAEAGISTLKLNIRSEAFGFLDEEDYEWSSAFNFGLSIATSTDYSLMLNFGVLHAIK